ncbi:MAG: response regulator transcription factor [Gemmatimonadota bacterium]
MERILVIEDNPDLAFGLRNNLEIEGYAVDVVEDGAEGLAHARATPPDLIILDLMIPGLDGYRVLKALREEGQETPVLILSARSEEADKVMGFRLGADDYVTKPFSVLELLGRVKALLRRTGHIPEEERATIRFGNVVLDPLARSVRRGGQRVPLPPREMALLLALARRMGVPVSRHDLLAEVWGHRGAVLSRTVDTHIAELRKKLEEDPSDPRHILTVRKSGYRLQP